MSAEGYRDEGDEEEEGEMGFEADMVLDWLVSEFCQCLVGEDTARDFGGFIRVGLILGLKKMEEACQ